MKLLAIVLILILAVLQYKLWFDTDGLNQTAALKKTMQQQVRENQNLQQRNQAMASEVDDLKHGQAAVEERARNDLGMVKKDEVYYQLSHKKPGES